MLCLRSVHRILCEVRDHGPLEDGPQGIACDPRNGASFRGRRRARSSGVYRRRGPVCMIALLLAVASLPLSWGDVVSGVRLGIGPGPSAPEPTLRLVFENVGVPEVQLPL